MFVGFEAWLRSCYCLVPSWQPNAALCAQQLLSGRLQWVDIHGKGRTGDR